MKNEDEISCAPKLSVSSSPSSPSRGWGPPRTFPSPRPGKQTQMIIHLQWLPFFFRIYSSTFAVLFVRNKNFVGFTFFIVILLTKNNQTAFEIKCIFLMIKIDCRLNYYNKEMIYQQNKNIWTLSIFEAKSGTAAKPK